MICVSVCNSHPKGSMFVRFSSIYFSILLAGCRPFFETGQEADILLGELGFNQSGGHLLSTIQGIATDGTVLMMADDNNRCCCGMNCLPPIRSPVSFLKQNFDTNNSGESETELKVADVARGGGKYIIADTYNHRILIWNELGTNASNPI